MTRGLANPSVPIVRLSSGVRRSVSEGRSARSRRRHAVRFRNRRSMKRSAAVLAFLVSIGVLLKLVLKPSRPGEYPGSSPTVSASSASDGGSIESASSATRDLSAKYLSESARVRDLVARVAERYGRNAQEIDRTDGLRGLALLDRMDLEAIFLYEKHPAEFRRLIGLVDEDTASDLLMHWREYFGLKRADEIDRQNLIAAVARLSPREQRVAARYPNALPLILAEPRRMIELIDRMKRDEPGLAHILAILCCINLERGSSDLRFALRVIDRHRSLATDAFRHQGLEGFAIVALYGPVLEALGDALPLDDSLILLRVNCDYVDELLLTHRPETVAAHLRHVAAEGLTDPVGGSPFALRLVVEYGKLGDRALKQAGPDAADVVFADFDDPTLRRQAVAALATHGTMALPILEKYASDLDFRQILRTHGAATVPLIAQADAAPETLVYLQSKSKRTFSEALAMSVLFASGDNGSAVIRLIKNEGMERAAQFNQNDVQFYQFLPMYDLIHLGNVVRRGYSPTSGEMTWALIDGSFVVADVLSLAAVQPEGAIASESVRTEVRAAVREGVRAVGEGLASHMGESAGQSLARHQIAGGLERAIIPGPTAASRRLARWWSVRSAGGFIQVLRKTPQALERMGLVQTMELAAPLCLKAGVRLSAWRPIRLVRGGVEVVLSIPPQRGLKYVTAQAVQAGVGVIGFRKMEEYLSSRRPSSSLMADEFEKRSATKYGSDDPNG
jgi:hypothetical protein